MIARPLLILDGVGLANSLVCSLQLRLLFRRHTSSMFAGAVIYLCHFLWKRSLEVLVTAAKREPAVPTTTCRDVLPRLGYLSAQTLILAPVLMSNFFVFVLLTFWMTMPHIKQWHQTRLHGLSWQQRLIFPWCQAGPPACLLLLRNVIWHRREAGSVSSLRFCPGLLPFDYLPYLTNDVRQIADVWKVLRQHRKPWCKLSVFSKRTMFMLHPSLVMLCFYAEYNFPHRKQSACSFISVQWHFLHKLTQVPPPTQPFLLHSQGHWTFLQTEK